MAVKGERVYVADPAHLHKLASELTKAPFIAVDTEFMRERTYYPRLCLIQVATESVCAIVDPLEVDDLAPLLDVLADTRIAKVLHAGVQDLEIFYRLMGSVPAPVFDTQVAATLAGFPQQVGYGALVREVTGVTLDKSDTFTDWSKRPLSGTQIEYALNDVRYLPAVYEDLRGRLEKERRLEWLKPDFERLEDPVSYEVVPEDTWRRLKRVSSLNRRQLGVLQAVAAWREREAQRRDIPRKWVIGDESLIEIARRAPSDPDALRQIRGIGDKLSGKGAEGMLAAVEKGLATPDDQLPGLERRPRRVPEGDGVVDLLAALVRIRAKQHNVAVPLLASRSDIERLAGGERDESPLLTGWRRQIVGEELLELLDGRLSLRIENGQVEVTPAAETGG